MFKVNNKNMDIFHIFFYFYFFFADFEQVNIIWALLTLKINIITGLKNHKRT